MLGDTIDRTRSSSCAGARAWRRRILLTSVYLLLFLSFLGALAFVQFRYPNAITGTSESYPARWYYSIRAMHISRASCQEKQDRRMRLWNMTRALLEELDKEGVRHWIDYGSLLGAVREGGMIVWDYDVDVSMFSTENKTVHQRVAPAMRARGYHMETTHFSGYNDWKVRLVDENGHVGDREYYAIDLFNWWLFDRSTGDHGGRGAGTGALRRDHAGREGDEQDNDTDGKDEMEKNKNHGDGDNEEVDPNANGGRVDIVGENGRGIARNRFYPERKGRAAPRRMGRNILPVDWILPLQRLPFEDVMASAPHQPATMLTYIYGKRFMAPHRTVPAKRRGLSPWCLHVYPEMFDSLRPRTQV